MSSCDLLIGVFYLTHVLDSQLYLFVLPVCTSSQSVGNQATALGLDNWGMHCVICNHRISICMAKVIIIIVKTFAVEVEVYLIPHAFVSQAMSHAVTPSVGAQYMTLECQSTFVPATTHPVSRCMLFITNASSWYMNFPPLGNYTCS